MLRVVDDDYRLCRSRADPLLKVANIDRTRPMTVTFVRSTTMGLSGRAPTKHPLLRRWDAERMASNIVEAPLPADNPGPSGSRNSNPIPTGKLRIGKHLPFRAITG